MSIKVLDLDHVGVRVADIEKSIAFYQGILGLTVESFDSLPDRGLKKAMLAAGSGIVELLQYAGQPVPENDGPVAHLAFRVDDIENVWEELKKAGAKLVDDQPRGLAGGMKIGFLRGPDNESIEIVQHG